MADRSVRQLARWRRRLSPIAIGLLTGLLGGMGAFMYSRTGLLPGGLAGWMPTGIVALAGVYTYLLVRDVRRSVTAMLTAFGVGIATLIAAWVAPLWLLPYAPAARDLLLPGLLQRAVTTAMTSYLLLFLGGYLTTMMVAGYLDW